MCKIFLAWWLMGWYDICLPDLTQWGKNNVWRRIVPFPEAVRRRCDSVRRIGRRERRKYAWFVCLGTHSLAFGAADTILEDSPTFFAERFANNSALHQVEDESSGKIIWRACFLMGHECLNEPACPNTREADSVCPRCVTEDRSRSRCSRTRKEDAFCLWDSENVMVLWCCVTHHFPC